MSVFTDMLKLQILVLLRNMYVSTIKSKTNKTNKENKQTKRVNQTNKTNQPTNQPTNQTKLDGTVGCMPPRIAFTY